MKSTYESLLGLALSVTILCFSSQLAIAHIKNEASQFPDIEYSDARFDIVVLVGAGIIPETPVFEPDKALSRRELATWAALARGLGEGGETPDTDELAAAALDAGLVEDLDGDATFADLNIFFLNGEAEVAEPNITPTKAQAASFIASRLDSEAGRELLEQKGLRQGTTGEVTEAASAEGHHGSGYVLTINGTTMPMDEHGRVANGPTDLLQWEGRNVRRSFVEGDGEHATWSYLEATSPEPAVAAAEPQAAEVQTTAPPPDRRLLYWLVAGAVLLGLALFFRRRRKA